MKRNENTYDTRDVTVFDNFKVTANGDNHFKLPRDWLISASNYEIYTKIIPYTPPIYTYGTIKFRNNMRLTPTEWIQITSEANIYDQPLLVSALHFERNGSTNILPE